MLYPCINKLLTKTNNDRYALCVVTAIRARQIISGAITKFETGKSVTDAVNEISERNIRIIKKK